MDHGVALPPTLPAPGLSVVVPKSQGAFLGSEPSGHRARAREAGGRTIHPQPRRVFGTTSNCQHPFPLSMVFERGIVWELSELFWMLLCAQVGLPWARVGLTSRLLPELCSAASGYFSLKDLVPLWASHWG